MNALSAFAQQLRSSNMLDRALYIPIRSPGKARNGDGAPYPISSRELGILQSSKFCPDRAPPPRKSMWEAMTLLSRPPQTNSSYHATERRIASASTMVPSWDLTTKMFNDIDTYLFHGDLYHRVQVQWKPFAHKYGIDTYGMTEAPNRRNPRITLTMRSDVNWDIMPGNFALGTMIHEMLHAYFLVHCGEFGTQEWGSWQDVEHGPLFTEAARRLEMRTGLDLLSDPDGRRLIGC